MMRDTIFVCACTCEMHMLYACNFLSITMRSPWMFVHCMMPLLTFLDPIFISNRQDISWTFNYLHIFTSRYCWHVPVPARACVPACVSVCSCFCVCLNASVWAMALFLGCFYFQLSISMRFPEFLTTYADLLQDNASVSYSLSLL